MHPTLTSNEKYISEEDVRENKHTSDLSEDDVMNYGFKNDVLP